jgi:hypothetical protein
MVKTSNHTPNRDAVCCEAIDKWNKIKKKNTEEIEDIIWNYMATPLNLYDIQLMKYKHSVPAKKLNPLPFTIHSVEPIPEIPPNASAQRKAANTIKTADEFQQIYNIVSDAQIRGDMYQKIENLQDEIKSNKERITKLKRNAKYAQNCKKKSQDYLMKIKRSSAMTNLKNTTSLQASRFT